MCVPSEQKPARCIWVSQIRVGLDLSCSHIIMDFLKISFDSCNNRKQCIRANTHNNVGAYLLFCLFNKFAHFWFTHFKNKRMRVIREMMCGGEWLWENMPVYYDDISVRLFGWMHALRARETGQYFVCLHMNIYNTIVTFSVFLRFCITICICIIWCYGINLTVIYALF